ncbi:MAG TPA: M20/M25/M40 family metallo-hydrolase [Terriglobales bacterium]|nr:M20/M25/M40 family metallo-hydrolase [Terriglobales bacterium]
MKILPQGRSAWVQLSFRWAIVLGLLVVVIAYMIWMPGKSYVGSLQTLSPEEEEIRANSRKHVSVLSATIGPRNTIQYKALQDAARYIEQTLNHFGYQVESKTYEVQGRSVRNLISTIPGGSRASEIVVIGAHYDTVLDTPGADDNASGVAALLELARILKRTHPARTVRLVAFVNEEPPFFQTASMGSWVYAKQVRRLNENIVASVSLETIGVYSDERGSQHYPVGLNLLYPAKGNFIGFVGNIPSRGLVQEMLRSFRDTTFFPSEGIAAPEWIAGIGWSDQWSFWQEHYPGVMVTDTAPFRNPNYHSPTDQAETLDYDRMARVINGLVKVAISLGR